VSTYDDDPDRTPPQGIPVAGQEPKLYLHEEPSPFDDGPSRNVRPPLVGGQFVHPQAVPPPPVQGYSEPYPSDVPQGGSYRQPGGQFLHSQAREPRLARQRDLEGAGGGSGYLLDADEAAGLWSAAPPVIGAPDSLPSPIPQPPRSKPQAEPEPESEREPRKRSLWGKITGRDR
jgi:hypothetical protein